MVTGIVLSTNEKGRTVNVFESDTALSSTVVAIIVVVSPSISPVTRPEELTDEFISPVVQVTFCWAASGKTVARSCTVEPTITVSASLSAVIIILSTGAAGLTVSEISP
jgi:hypothetical protein